MWTAYLDWSLSHFSGSVAIDELYDGPFSVIFIVDNRSFRRLMYDVLEHAPQQDDVARLLRRFRMALSLRSLQLRGVTTDGSPLYPQPLSEVFPGISHQICEFHMIKELNLAVLRAVARIRKKLAEMKPPTKRGRPFTPEAKRIARQRSNIQAKIAKLFEQRYLFVQHHLSQSERDRLQSITHGLPQLRALREIVDEVYRLFDRRCRTETALAKLAKLRQRVHRFKTIGKILNRLYSPNLEKALLFLDNQFLAPTSNSVERGNRRHRKMQKSIYGLRTQEHITNRIALDMLHDSKKDDQHRTLETLHQSRKKAA
jgi:hypothetical protein